MKWCSRRMRTPPCGSWARAPHRLSARSSPPSGSRENEAVLHRDPTLMPRRRAAWSSWNYLAEGRARDRTKPVSLTYWMNRLQGLQTRAAGLRDAQSAPRAARRRPVRLCTSAVRPGGDRRPGGDPSIQGLHRTWFAGAWCGYGFHEDGLRAGLEVAAALGAPAPVGRRAHAFAASEGGRREQRDLHGNGHAPALLSRRAPLLLRRLLPVARPR